VNLWTPRELCDSIRPERVNAVIAFGFTERQARFLVHVLVHAGVFIERQYCAFAQNRSRPEHARLSGQARQPRLRDRYHARRAAPRPTVSRAVQAVVRGDWRAK